MYNDGIRMSDFREGKFENMTMKEFKVKVKDLFEGYSDHQEEGATAYGGRLTIRPPYQREFFYDEKKQRDVVYSVLFDYSLNEMTWSRNKQNGFDIMDGQQRTVSLLEFCKGKFAIVVDGKPMFYRGLPKDLQERIDNYELKISIYEGSESTRLQWFRMINTAGGVMTDQELRNIAYVGPWLHEAKKHFSKIGCPAVDYGDKRIKGNSIRQEIFEMVLEWIADRDSATSKTTLEDYMAKHQYDKDDNDLWNYYRSVIDWANRTFSSDEIKGFNMCRNDWGILYNEYHNEDYNVNDLREMIKKLSNDEDVTKTAGIIPYLLSVMSEKGRNGDEAYRRSQEKFLNIRAFSPQQKKRAYERQNHKCACCGEELPIDKMEGDHITPWSEGGRTIDENLQMLCVECNRRKGTR